jgi:hypothetical protein
MVQRLVKRNKQQMYYSLYNEERIKYTLDSNGDKIPVLNSNNEPMLDDEGNIIYMEDGKEVVYAEPVSFSANISSQLNELHARAYGVDQSSIYSEICVSKGALPLQYGSLIWRESKPQYTSEGLVDNKSADYTVTGLMTESLNADWYLLQRNTK